jgi:sterol desaturase/sphingolipid hydroxylase (fatty acid hydroxylase superfamily)
MNTDPTVKRQIFRDLSLSTLFYLAPVVAMFAWMKTHSEKPWLSPSSPNRPIWSLTTALHLPAWLSTFLLDHWLMIFVVLLGFIELALGLYDEQWDANEKKLDAACLVLTRALVTPAAVLLTLKLCNWLIPSYRSFFGWVPFFWGFAILVIADDLTQYWYHRLHHQLPWLWRFHRTHHSAPYMGMAMAYRQNLLYIFFFSQTYLTAAFVFLGLGPAAVAMQAVKSIIVVLSHSSVPWDKPLYQYRVLHPLAWVVERLISTPATHHAHHAATTDDGVGYYKGNFGNMFFIWDVVFGTAHFSRQYPKVYGISHYEKDPWHAQMLWPLFKSNVTDSELAQDGPVVRADLP